ncbi:hypothetical protein [Isobaculum melis]|uniref:Uncharacterized protein n=1 Tax=Isobaculum melis TaxID=142588 RepID=A0A1H9QUT8_9LACT|nr:hypothetical protein [Isobaculum melis]SER63463.1 hypothetical protein SAMN04488559_102260 [Isobaculum melis]
MKTFKHIDELIIYLEKKSPNLWLFINSIAFENKPTETPIYLISNDAFLDFKNSFKTIYLSVIKKLF